jgi:hypothetical protein
MPEAPASTRGLTFTSGIDYAFPAGTVLAPGAYLVLTRADGTATSPVSEPITA